MLHSKKTIYGTFVVAAAITFLLDVISKKLIVQNLNEPIVLIENFLRITKHSNEGIAFGIGVPQSIQIVASITIVVILIYVAATYFFTKQSNVFLNAVLFGIIIGGAIGNLFDRIKLGYVTDFIDLWPIPTFNIADIGITVGLVILMLLMLREEMKN